MSTTQDAAFMRRALQLARQGRGMTHPNPMVGAVVVREDTVIAEGYHEVYGGPHAEVVALERAGAEARGASLYVTLEPCAHHGKTPPCVDAILEAGVARVVYAADDPDTQAAGGAAKLRAAGVDVVGGVERDDAHTLNHQFFRTRAGLTPYMALKLAVSLDGGIARAAGVRTRITGEAAQAETHRLRAEHEAILVGSRTALIDDPLLTVRGAACRTPPIRIVLDTEARLPASAQLLRTLDQADVWVLCAAGANSDRVQELQRAGARILPVARSAAGLDLHAVHRALDAAGVRSVLVEGGGTLAAGLLAAGLLDRLYFFAAPVLLGSDRVPAFPAIPHTTGGTSAGGAAKASEWRYTGMERFGDDVLLTLDPAGGPVESH